MDEDARRILGNYLDGLQAQAMILVLAYISLFSFSNRWRLLLACCILIHMFLRTKLEHILHQGFASFGVYWMCIYSGN